MDILFSFLPSRFQSDNSTVIEMKFPYDRGLSRHAFGP